MHVSHAVSSAASRPAAWPARPQEQLERERALADAVDLEKKEEEFHLRQARVRASLRIAHGRSRPIDLLAANLSFFAARTEAASAPPGSDAAKAVPRFNARLEPESLTDGLSAAELAELETDVSALAQLDTEEPENAEFWENMTLICAWERAQATRREQADRAASRGLPPPPSMEHGLHASLDDDVASMFAGKPHSELLSLREQIADSLASGAAAEPEYWQAVLRRCEVWLARARVRDLHSALRARALAVAGGAAELDVRAAMRWDEEEPGAAAGVGGPPAAEEEDEEDSAAEELYRTFASPWADAPCRPEPDLGTPACYLQQPPYLSAAMLQRFSAEALFYLFYSCPGEDAQLGAAEELASRAWFWHKELKAWLQRAPGAEAAVKAERGERGSYVFFDSSSWERVRKDGFLLDYAQLDETPRPRQQQGQQQQSR